MGQLDRYKGRRFSSSGSSRKKQTPLQQTYGHSRRQSERGYKHDAEKSRYQAGEERRKRQSNQAFSADQTERSRKHATSMQSQRGFADALRMRMSRGGNVSQAEISALRNAFGAGGGQSAQSPDAIRAKRRADYAALRRRLAGRNAAYEAKAYNRRGNIKTGARRMAVTNYSWGDVTPRQTQEIALRYGIKDLPQDMRYDTANERAARVALTGKARGGVNRSVSASFQRDADAGNQRVADMQASGRTAGDAYMSRTDPEYAANQAQIEAYNRQLGTPVPHMGNAANQRISGIQGQAENDSSIARQWANRNAATPTPVNVSDQVGHALNNLGGNTLSGGDMSDMLAIAQRPRFASEFKDGLEESRPGTGPGIEKPIPTPGNTTAEQDYEMWKAQNNQTLIPPEKRGSVSGGIPAREGGPDIPGWVNPDILQMDPTSAFHNPQPTVASARQAMLQRMGMTMPDSPPPMAPDDGYGGGGGPAGIAKPIPLPGPMPPVTRDAGSSVRNPPSPIGNTGPQGATGPTGTPPAKVPDGITVGGSNTLIYNGKPVEDMHTLPSGDKSTSPPASPASPAGPKALKSKYGTEKVLARPKEQPWKPKDVDAEIKAAQARFDLTEGTGPSAGAGAGGINMPESVGDELTRAKTAQVKKTTSVIEPDTSTTLAKAESKDKLAIRGAQDQIKSITADLTTSWSGVDEPWLYTGDDSKRAGELADRIDSIMKQDPSKLAGIKAYFQYDPKGIEWAKKILDEATNVGNQWFVKGAEGHARALKRLYNTITSKV